MKKMGFLVLFWGFLAFAAFAQQNPSIIIVNDTEYEIRHVYISPSSEHKWGDDLLDSTQVLKDGESFSVSLPHPLNRVNKYDIRLVDTDGDTYTKNNVTVQNNSRIVFVFDDIDW